MGPGQIAESTVLIRIVTAGERKAEKLKKALEGTRKVTDQLDRELKSAFSTRNLTGINKAVTALDKFEVEAKQANKALEKLQRTSSRIKPVNASVKGGGGGAGVAAAAGSGLLGSSLLGGGVAKVSQASKKLSTDLEQTNEASKKLEANLAKQEETVNQLNELYRVQPFLVGQTSDKIKQSNESLAKAKANLSDNKSEIKRLEARLRGLKPAAEKYTNEVKEGTRELRLANDRAKALKSTLNGIKKTGSFLGGKGSGLRGALVAGGGGLAARSAFNAAALKESTQARVQVLEGEFTQLIGLNEKAAQSADKFLLSQTQVLQDYINLGNRLGEQGASLEDLQNIYEGLNTVLVKNRATAQEAASATLQLSQALGAGKLQGEEFRAINEAAPQVITEVSKVLKVTRGEVKDLAAEGKVSSKVLLQALTNLRRNGADQLEAGFTGAFRATRQFQKALTEFSETVGEELLPVITPLLEGASEILKEFGSWDKETRQLTVNTLLLGAALLVVAGPLATLISGAGKLLIFLGKLTPLILGTAAATTKWALALAGLKVALVALPFVAIGGALVALAIDMRRVNKETELLNKRLKSDDLEDVKVATQELTEEKNKLQKQLESLQGSAWYRGIAGDIAALEGRIADLDELINQAVRRRQLIIEVQLLNKGVKKIENFDELTPAQIQQAFALAGVDPDGLRGLGGGSGGGRSGGAKRESRVPELEREKQLSEDLLLLNKKQLDAQLAENPALVETLERKKLILQADKDIADINAQKDVPPEEKVLEVAIRRIQLSQDLNALENQRATRVRDEARAIEDALRPLEQQRALLDAQLSGRGREQQILQQIDDIMRGLPESERQRVTELVRGNAAREDQLEQLRKQQQMWKSIESTIANGVTNAILGVIQGTKTLQESLAEVLNSIARILISSAVNTAVGSVFKDLGLTRRASGGPVTGGTPYIVGEKGPELMIPSSSGRIIPNDDFDAARAAMGGSSGGGSSSVDGAFGATSDSVTATRERLIQNEMQATAAKYTSDPITFETIQIGSMDVVTREEAEAIGQASAQQARAQVFGDLRNKPAARRQVGLR